MLPEVAVVVVLACSTQATAGRFNPDLLKVRLNPRWGRAVQGSELTDCTRPKDAEMRMRIVALPVVALALTLSAGTAAHADYGTTPTPASSSMPGMPGMPGMKMPASTAAAG